uniref:Putative NBS-LRR class RGA n=1 Tax=Oryza rufipogon TaxID=4529 RepID=A0A0E0RC10_ORYRU|nr:putative NBS-LRR class RGA [Oryza rufipogon]
MAKLVTETTKDGHHTTNVTTVERPTTALPHNRAALMVTSELLVKVTGRDKNREQLQTLLRAEEHNVICIHGISGSGKTTLAQYVCEPEKKAGYFELVMWIHVTQNFTVDSIFREMFEAASGNKEPCPNSPDVLQTKLKGVLGEKRFLLVLDDVWYNKDDHKNKEQLQQVLSPLKVGKTGSKILVTSRRALSHIGLVKCSPFPIPEMESDDFFQLFMHYALGDITLDDMDVRKHIGKQIVKKLKGSPLAASIVGLRLRENQDISHWMEFIAQEHLDDVTDFLSWSYQHFDKQVRRCFSYCSIFPRRHRLDRDELISMWVAQGFIRSTGTRKDLETLGQQYFDELVSFSFVNKHTEEHTSRVYFTVHDLLHDLAEKVSGNDCFAVQKGWAGVLPRDVRHLFIEIYGDESISKKVLELEHLRTLIIIHRRQKEKSSAEVFESVFAKLPKLRVLILKIETMDNPDVVNYVPESIDKLKKHLRYFAFEGHVTEWKELPATFSQLYHLEVVHVKPFAFSSSWIYSTRTTNLRWSSYTTYHVEFPNIGNLESLRTLGRFTVKTKQGLRKLTGYELYQLKRLNKLRGRLKIQFLNEDSSREDALEAELHKKVYLTELDLQWSFGWATPQEDVQSQVLEALRPPKQLQKLEIHSYKGSSYPSWMMRDDSDVPMCLQLLWISDSTKLQAIPEHTVLLSNLRMLRISGDEWDYLPENMENLKLLVELEILDCKKLRSLPTVWPPSLKKLTITMMSWHRLRSLPTMPESLEHFRLVSLRHKFTKSCETPGHQNYENIRHIPNKTISCGGCLNHNSSQGNEDEGLEDDEEFEDSEYDQEDDEDRYPLEGDQEDDEDFEASEDHGEDHEIVEASEDDQQDDEDVPAKKKDEDIEASEDDERK